MKFLKSNFFSFRRIQKGEINPQIALIILTSYLYLENHIKNFNMKKITQIFILFFNFVSCKNNGLIYET